VSAAAGFIAGIAGAIILTLLLSIGAAAIGGMFGPARPKALIGRSIHGIAGLLGIGNAIVCLIESTLQFPLEMSIRLQTRAIVFTLSI